MVTAINRFFSGAKQGLREEFEGYGVATGFAILPIIAAIAGYKYIKENEEMEINSVLTLASIAGILSLTAVTIPLGLVADLTLLATTPPYILYKGYKSVIDNEDKIFCETLACLPCNPKVN